MGVPAISSAPQRSARFVALMKFADPFYDTYNSVVNLRDEKVSKAVYS